MMIMQQTPTEIADRHSRKRAWIFGILAVFFPVASIAFYRTYTGNTDAWNPGMTEWFVLALMVALLVYTGGALFKNPRVRAIMNDELTQLHRRRAMEMGFCVAAISALAVFGITGLWADMSGRLAVYIVLTASLSAALATWAILEIRSHW